MPEMSGKSKSNPTKTNNLIYILKITQKMRIWNFFWKPETDPIKEETDPKKEETDPKNEETDQQTENLQPETDPKKEETYLKKWKLINKLRIYNFFWKSETDPKNEETDPKKGGETNQQTENLKLFLKTGNGPKKWGNGSKILGNPSKIWDPYKPESDLKIEETDKKTGNSSKKWIWGISDNFWKKQETPQKN